jgi:hypothetical protein
MAIAGNRSVMTKANEKYQPANSENMKLIEESEI